SAPGGRARGECPRRAPRARGAARAPRAAAQGRLRSAPRPCCNTRRIPRERRARRRRPGAQRRSDAGAVVRWPRVSRAQTTGARRVPQRALIEGRASRTLAAMVGTRTRGSARFALAAWVAAAVLVGANEPRGEGLEAALARVPADPGRALRAAVAATQRGDREQGEALLRAVAEHHPVIADHADLLRMKMYVGAGDAERAAAEEPLWTDRDSPLRARFYALPGEAERARGDEERARAAFEFAAAGARDRGRLAELDLAIAQSYLRGGLRERAAERLLTVWTRSADLPPAEQADSLLAQLERELGHPLRTALPTRDPADQLLGSHHNESALAAYDHALELGLPRADRTRVQRQRAETLFRLRRYTDAIDAYRTLPASEEREIQRARAVARAGNAPEGARALERLGRERRGERAVEALYLAAVLWDGENEHARARELLELVIRRLPPSSFAASARWSPRWARHREGPAHQARAQLR